MAEQGSTRVQREGETMTAIIATEEPRPSLSLSALAEQINEENRLCEESLRAGLEHALRAGALLLEAKARCDHGTWGAWLRENCEVSERTAQAYMRVARERPALESKTQRVADLSFRAALQELAAPRAAENYTVRNAEQATAMAQEVSRAGKLCGELAAERLRRIWALGGYLRRQSLTEQLAAAVTSGAAQTTDRKVESLFQECLPLGESEVQTVLDNVETAFDAWAGRLCPRWDEWQAESRKVREQWLAEAEGSRLPWISGWERLQHDLQAVAERFGCPTCPQLSCPQAAQR